MTLQTGACPACGNAARRMPCQVCNQKSPDAARQLGASGDLTCVQHGNAPSPGDVKPRPIRIQRRRVTGWRLPAKTIYVGRGSGFGNPFIIGCHGTAEEVVALYREHVTAILRNSYDDGEYFRQKLGKLRNRNLACWCPLDQPCHADVLLEIANA